MPSLTQLGRMDAPRTPIKVKVLPAGIQYLPLSGPSDYQHGHDIAQHRVFGLKKAAIEPLGFLGGQVARHVVVLLEERIASRGVLGNAGRLPLQGQIEHVAQQDQQPVARTGSMGSLVLGQQGNQVGLGDLVQMP